MVRCAIAIGYHIAAIKLQNVAGNKALFSLVAFVQRFIGIQEPVICSDQNIGSVHIIRNQPDQILQFRNCLVARFEYLIFRSRFITDCVDRIVIDIYHFCVFYKVAALGSLFTGRITLPGAQQGAEGVSTPVSAPEPTERVDVDMSAWESFFPVSFPDKQQERAVRAALDKPEGNILLSELPGIDALYFCGNMNLKSLDGVRFEADGTLTVNGASPIEGTVADLGVIGRMPLLEELALIRQPATDLSPLAALTQLHTLSLAGSALSTLDTLAGQGSVETLHLEHSGVRELSALGELPGLKTVTVSAEMLPLSWDDGADYEIILVR